MWLPKDERELLKRFYKELHESGVETRGQLFLNELEKCLQGKNKRNRVRTASKILMRRNLLDFLNDQGGAITARLSLEGNDLGRKYSSWWTRSGLWFAEYRNHWIWIIVSFLGGVIGGLLINWLSKGD